MSEAFDEVAANRRKRGVRRAAKVSALKNTKPARRNSRGQASVAAPSRWRGVRMGLFLLGLCVAFGVQSAYQSQRIRALYSELQQNQVSQDELLAQRSRLLIERGAMSSFNGTETLATQELKMRFPETIRRVPGSGATLGDRR